MSERAWKQLITRGGLASAPLWLASLAYRCGFAISRALRRPSVRLDVPVISIGNIAVGGAGKTPIVGWLAEELGHRGYKVGIVARGYKRVGRTPVLAFGADIQKMDAGLTGDEVMMLAQALPHVMFSVDATKWRAARALATSGTVNLILVDDGFQHWPLHRDLDILLLDASMNPALARPFPYGVLREGFSALHRADVLIITRANLGHNVAWLKNQISRSGASATVLEARFIANDIHASHTERLPVTYLKNRAVFLFAGIGHFGVLADQVKRLAGHLAGTLELADHQEYDQALLERIRDLAQQQNADLLLTTAKDWAKLGNFDFGRETYYLGLTVKLDRDRELLDMIAHTVRHTG